MERPRRWFWACVLLSATLTLLVGRDVLFRGKTFVPTDFLTSRPPWGPPEATDAYLQNRSHQDIVEFYATHAVATANAYREGHLLLWNDQIFCGLAVVGDPQLGTFYPPRVLSYLLFAPIRALDVFILVHYFFAGLAMYAFVRGWGGGGPAAVASGVLWMLCGQTMVWFKYGSGLVAFVFFPLMALALHRAFERKSRTAAAGAGALWALILAGSHPQLAFLALVWVAIYGLGRVRTAGWRWSLGAMMGFAIAGVGLEAVQLFPFLESVVQSNKTVVGTGMAFERPTRTPLLLLTLLWQRCYGSPIDRLDMNSRWMGVNFFEFQGYEGLLPLALALLAWKRSKLLAGTAVAVLGFATLYPAWWVVQTVVPVLRVMVPHRLFLYGFAASALAGLGWEQSLSSPPSRRFIGMCFLGFLGVVILGAIGWASSHKWVSLVNPPYATLVVATGSAMAAIAVLRSRADARWKISACLAAVAVDLIPTFLSYNHSHELPPPEPAVLARLPRSDRVLVCIPSAYWHEEIRNYLMYYGLSTPVGFASQFPRPYAEMVTALGGMGFDRWTVLDPKNERTLDVLNVASVLTAEGEVRRTPFPRAWLVGSHEVIPRRDERLRRLAEPTFDLRRSVILEVPVGIPPQEIRGQAERTGPDAFRVRCDRPCLLVVSETFHPGWHCSVDGAPTALLPANHAMRAVVLSAGDHDVRFVFRPASVRLGALVSFLTAAVLAAAFLARKWKSLRRGTASSPKAASP